MAIKPVNQIVTANGTGGGTPIALDRIIYGITSIYVFMAGTGTYTIEGTLDPLSISDGIAGDIANPTLRWFTLPEFPAKTASFFASIGYPLQAVRINFSVAPAGGACELKVMQNGTRGGF